MTHFLIFLLIILHLRSLLIIEYGNVSSCIQDEKIGTKITKIEKNIPVITVVYLLCKLYNKLKII